MVVLLDGTWPSRPYWTQRTILLLMAGISMRLPSFSFFQRNKKLRAGCREHSPESPVYSSKCSTTRSAFKYHQLHHHIIRVVWKAFNQGWRTKLRESVSIMLHASRVAEEEEEKARGRCEQSPRTPPKRTRKTPRDG